MFARLTLRPLNNFIRPSLLSSTLKRNGGSRHFKSTHPTDLQNSTLSYSRQKIWLGIGGATVFATLSLSLASHRKVHSDAPSPHSMSATVVDPATSITFPTTLNVPAKVKLPTLSLIGVGVRTVSFLGIKVYSVGFYADLNNPNLNIPKDMTVQEKVKHIVNNTACVIRIVPTRSTSYSHLRDAFMRALQARMTKSRTEGTLTEEEAIATGAPMRKLKTLFPNSSLAKHTPFDIFLSPPVPGRPRSLVFRDMGAVENDWVATELVLHYFEGDAPSPALKEAVLEKLESFKK